MGVVVAVMVLMPVVVRLAQDQRAQADQLKGGLPLCKTADRDRNLQPAKEFAQARNRNLARHLLLIDEAHYLATGQGFYLAHYLTNLRIPATGAQAETPLFTIIMAGTEALRESIKEFESLRRRIQLDWTIRPLSPQQTSEYVQHHMRAVGGDIWSFGRDALDAVYHFSQGIPRSINNLCDTALMLGFASQASQIGSDIIDQAAQDTGLASLAPAATEQESTP